MGRYDSERCKAGIRKEDLMMKVKEVWTMYLYRYNIYGLEKKRQHTAFYIFIHYLSIFTNKYTGRFMFAYGVLFKERRDKM